MAKICELNEPIWSEWVATRPESVQRLCRLFPPNNLYLLKTSGHRVTIYSYSEDDTLTVEVSGQYNALTFARRVFGVRPEDLEECELPESDEILGEILPNEEDIKQYCEIKENNSWLI